MAIDKEHLYITIGGVLASAVIAYLIYRMEAQDNAQNTEAQIEASDNEAAEEQQYIAQLPSIGQSAPSSTTTYSSSGDIATGSTSGIPAPDAGIEALIAGFQSAPENSVVLQSTPIATVAPIQAPAQTTVATVTIPTLDFSTSSGGSLGNTLNNPLVTNTGAR